MNQASEALRPELVLPPLEAMADELRALVGRSDAAARCLAAATTGTFVDREGREDVLNLVRVSPAALALIVHLSTLNPAKFSIDIGFGMGGSVAMALAAQKDRGKPFTHLSFDPVGLTQGGDVVQAYLDDEFPDEFKRVWKTSQVGLGQLLDQHGYGCAGYVFVDGGHTFEQVMVDFSLSDQLCCIDGHIVFDDAYYPAIEGVIEYIRTNRPDYAVCDNPVPNTSVVRKLSYDYPPWDAFEPFILPDRRRWTPRIPDWDASLPPERPDATAA